MRLLKKFCNERVDSKTDFDSSYTNLKVLARQLKKEFGKEVTDEINVVFWAKDEDGAPCLVNGAYNYWSGDAEYTLSEIADGAYPRDFMKALDKYIEDLPSYLREITAENVADALIHTYNLDIDRRELQEIIDNVHFDYEKLYDVLSRSHELKGDKHKFFNFCSDAEEMVSDCKYGWEYSTVEQGNLWYGRSNSVKGPVFYERIDMFDHNADDFNESDINESGLRRLAEKIAKHTTERPRY
jgi:hypothetical protein